MSTLDDTMQKKMKSEPTTDESCSVKKKQCTRSQLVTGFDKNNLPFVQAPETSAELRDESLEGSDHNVTPSWVLSRMFSSSESKFRFDDENVISTTSEAQKRTEEGVARKFSESRRYLRLDPEFPDFPVNLHIKYLLSCLKVSGSELQDSSRVWVMYWCTHSLVLLKHEFDPLLKNKIIKFLDSCQDKERGGFGGGPLQYPHLAPTYAAVNTLCTLGTEEAYKIIDRPKLKAFLYSLKQKDGSFIMHESGEVDLRGVYCALAVAKITNIYDEDLFKNSVEWIVSCQSYEGGFGSYSYGEAHGGYSFCATASLHILSSLHLCDIRSLIRWTERRQMIFEGGFQGRVNKLVDSCYSFWQSGALAIIQNYVETNSGIHLPEWWFDGRVLQMYLLICCQDPEGGIKDKPTARRDPYHTCYALSGLSVAQHQPSKVVMFGSKVPLLAETDPAYNIEKQRLKKAFQYFKNAAMC